MKKRKKEKTSSVIFIYFPFALSVCVLLFVSVFGYIYISQSIITIILSFINIHPLKQIKFHFIERIVAVNSRLIVYVVANWVRDFLYISFGVRHVFCSIFNLKLSRETNRVEDEKCVLFLKKIE